mgnify:CR=1 FL=1
MMDVRYASHPDDVKKYDTETLRKHYFKKKVNTLSFIRKKH